ncbi:MAG: DUF4294 domain-containing protein [Flavobacteriaceae bacterium]|nr:DUF4294 domain-containing protein [Flavobacteriaceae bacterium]
MKTKILIIFLLINSAAYAQRSKSVKIDSLKTFGEYIIYEGDTLIIELREVQLLDKMKFVSEKDKRYYFWFRDKVIKSYPYATYAAEKLAVLDERLQKIPSKSKRKKYVLMAQNYMENEFSDKLKKLTRTNGRIMIKLIHRQTNETVFNLIKDYRSGWNAFWYNATAYMFDLSLKMPYDPVNVDEDFLIEQILQREFINGTLIEQKPKIPINIEEIKEKRKQLKIVK